MSERGNVPGGIDNFGVFRLIDKIRLKFNLSCPECNSIHYTTTDGQKWCRICGWNKPGGLERIRSCNADTERSGGGADD